MCHVLGAWVVEPREIERASALRTVAALPPVVALTAVRRVVVAQTVAAALDFTGTGGDGCEQVAAVARDTDLAVLVAAAVALVANAVTWARSHKHAPNGAIVKTPDSHTCPPT